MLLSRSHTVCRKLAVSACCRGNQGRCAAGGAGGVQFLQLYAQYQPPPLNPESPM